MFDKIGEDVRIAQMFSVGQVRLKALFVIDIYRGENLLKRVDSGKIETF